MRVLFFALLIVASVSGCIGTDAAPGAEPEGQVEPQRAASAIPESDASTDPAADATPAGPPSVPPGHAAMRGEITLMALGGHPTPSDRLGLTFTLPEGYARGTVTLSWTASLPTNSPLALRLHAPGVLDAEGRVVGSADLVLEASGTSPVVVELQPSGIPVGSYDVHAYTSESEAAPIVVRQPFEIVVEWS